MPNWMSGAPPHKKFKKSSPLAISKPLGPEYFVLPEYKTGPAPADSDHDGMPDDWETKRGLDPQDAKDGSLDKDGDGYTNVEEWLNATDPTEKIDYTKSENNVNTLPR